jgi:hypothetical protein
LWSDGRWSCKWFGIGSCCYCHRRSFWMLTYRFIFF